MTISSDTRLAAVLGWPVHHSKSPAMHNAAFAHVGVDAVYLAMAVKAVDLSVFLDGIRRTSVLGINLTIPHKTAALPLCDRLSDAAAMIGAVNTLEFCQDGSMVGHNTDAKGFVRSFEEEMGNSMAGLSVVIMGGGGAARAVAYGATQAGARLSVVVRDPAKIEWTQALPWKAVTWERVLPACDLLIDCTSIGLSSETEKIAQKDIDVGDLPASAIVSSLVYHRETLLLKQATRRGLRVLNGRGMLLHQGALAFSIWTGKPLTVGVMRAMSACL